MLFFHPFLPRNGNRKNPATGNEHVRFGVWKFGVRDFKGLVSHYLAATKKHPGTGNENLGHANLF